MYIFDLSQKYFTAAEQALLQPTLRHHQLDEKIWPVFACLFRAGVKGTQPWLLRIYRKQNFCGAVVLVKCSRYGRALFDNKLLAAGINLARVPFYLWLKFGCCMDMFSNPGFVTEPAQAAEIHSAAVTYLRQRSLLTIICDYVSNRDLYPAASQLPAVSLLIISAVAPVI